jgi:magnesium chelatase subunit I
MHDCLGLIRHSGNDALFAAVEMSLLSTYCGQPLHLHAEGLRGTGKTTVLRAARRVLPRIVRIKGCIYNCEPQRPHCPNHRNLSPAEVQALGEERVPMPFLEISHSAKVGTAVGSIDLARLVDPTQPEAALLPGTLVQAHRGIVLVDEINRLAETAPELADILLDAMGTKPGRVQIEETGMPGVELPVTISVWAASNPDEDPGPLEEVRRQLSDRFDFVIPTGRPRELQVVRQVLDGMLDGPAVRSRETARAEVYRTRLTTAALTYRQVEVPAPLREQVAELYTRFDLESLRAVQAMLLGVQALASLAGRKQAELSDLVRVLPLALQHRVESEVLAGALGFLQGRDARVAMRNSLAGLMAGSQRGGPVGAQGAAPAAAGAASPAVTPWSATGAALTPNAGAGVAGGDAGGARLGAPAPAGRTGAAGPSHPTERAHGATWADGGGRSPAPQGGGAGQPDRQMGVAAQTPPDDRPRWWQRLLGTYTPGAAGGRAGEHPAAYGARPGQTGANQGQILPPRPGQALGQAGGGSLQMADPARSPVSAPPAPARSILELAEPELVRTREDLKG